MKTQDAVLLFAVGLAIWIAGTVYFAWQGTRVLETTPTRYWTYFIISPVFSAVMCIGILYWRRIRAADWAPAMLLLALPGMIGESIVLTNYGYFMAKLHPATGGRYAALLFATYALVLALADVVTLTASR